MTSRSLFEDSSLHMRVLYNSWQKRKERDCDDADRENLLWDDRSRSWLTVRCCLCDWESRIYRSLLFKKFSSSIDKIFSQSDRDAFSSKMIKMLLQRISLFETIKMLVRIEIESTINLANKRIKKIIVFHQNSYFHDFLKNSRTWFSNKKFFIFSLNAFI